MKCLVVDIAEPQSGENKWVRIWLHKTWLEPAIQYLDNGQLKKRLQKIRDLDDL